MAKKKAVIRELEEENNFLASEVASLVEENQLLKKKFRESQGSTKEDKDCKKLKEEIQRFPKEIYELKIYCLQKYKKHQRDKEQVETKELREKHQEKMAKKKAVIRELEEENNFLASEVASLVEENKLLKKKFRESQGSTKEDKDCKKLKEEIQKFPKEIYELKIISILHGSKKLEQHHTVSRNTKNVKKTKNKWRQKN